MKHALTLALALCLCATVGVAARRGDQTHATARAFRADGINRRASTSRPARLQRERGSKVVPGPRGQNGSVVKRPNGDKLPSIETAPPAVTEVDTEGLRKLLQRDADPSKARPLLVNFWATWCDPCREEFPDLVKIDTEFRARGLDFIIVSADDVSEIKTGVPAFLKKMRATMPSYILNTPDVEAAMSLVDPRWGGELPATFLLDRKGEVVFKHFGRVKLAELRPAIEKALAGN